MDKVGQLYQQVKCREMQERNQIRIRIRRKAKTQASGIWWGGKAVGEGRGYSDTHACTVDPARLYCGLLVDFGYSVSFCYLVRSKDFLNVRCIPHVSMQFDLDPNAWYRVGFQEIMQLKRYGPR
jgi:hypothetical protein